MSQPPRQILKLKLNTANVDRQEAASTPTPSSGKIKLKLSTPKTEKAPKAATPTPKKTATKASSAKKEKPLKITIGKKRNISNVDDGELNTPSKLPKLKLRAKSKQTPVTPSSLKLKVKGRPPPRPKGQGYDSEASDAEEDPSIEENFILRMMPGEDCDYVQKAIQERNWGKEGAKVRLKFLQADGRRAVLTVRGKLYAAIFVDMPCIVEGVKSWDKKSWYKVADICQMLMVLGVVQNDAEALNFPLPEREVDPRTWAYAHGLTPPMHWVRKRRFRKRTSHHTIEQVEAQVQALLQADSEAFGDVRYEVEDPRRLAAQSTQAGTDQSDMDEDDDLDGEGEMDDEGMGDEAEADGQEEDGEDIGAAFESFMAQGEAEGTIEVEQAETPASSAAVMEVQRMESTEAESPAAGTTSKDETEEEESDKEEDEVDEEEMEQRADIQRQREEITDLESAIKDQTAELDRVQSNMLKSKIKNKIQSLKADLELKKSAIGEGEDD
ncbi:hypothetical protein MMC10_000571 [Thelotrema lepadinum]|nr:hypothetical protein [Thelotrema lepadinum]